MSPPYQLYPREQYNRQQHEQQQQIIKWGSGWTTSSSSRRPPPTPQFRFGSGFTTPPPPPQSAVYHHPSHPYQQQQRGSIVCSPSPQSNQRPSALPSSVYPLQQTQQPQPPLVNNNMKEKKVTFKETCTVRTHRNNTPLTPTEKSKLHYSRQELRTMTLEAHAICILSQELPQRLNEGTLLTKKDRRRSGTFYSTNTATTNTSSTTAGPKVKRRGSWLGLNEDQDTTAASATTSSPTSNNGSSSSSIMLDSIRGLELILYTKRKQNKILANRSLLKYQQLLQSKDYLTTERKVQALAVASVKLTTWSKLVALETARLDALRAYDSDYLIPIEPLEGEDTIMPFPYYKKVEDKVSEKYQEQEHRRQQLNMKRRRRESYTRRVTFDRPSQGYDGFDNGKRRKIE